MDESDERRQRLKALRDKAKGSGNEDGKGIKFRNYRPADESLQPQQEPVAAKSSEGEAGPEKADQIKGTGKRTREGGDDEDVIKAELRKTTEENGEETLNIAPRKPNWDLKRDVSKKMEKLKKMTERAIVDLLREKLANEGGETDEEEEEEEE